MGWIVPILFIYLMVYYYLEAGADITKLQYTINSSTFYMQLLFNISELCRFFTLVTNKYTWHLTNLVKNFVYVLTKIVLCWQNNANNMNLPLFIVCCTFEILQNIHLPYL